MNSSAEMQPWDDFIKQSTMLLGGSKTINPVQGPTYGAFGTAINNPTTGGLNVPKPVTSQEQLAVRRELDNAVRYNRPSAYSREYGRRIGAI